MGAAGLSKCRFDTSKCSECCEHLEALECASSPDLDGRDSQALLNHALLRAARDGQLSAIVHALEAGASIETRRPFVMTLDSVATTTTDPTTQTCGIGLTPLMIAAEEGYTLACELLISKRACVNSEDEDGMRPLHFAAFAGCPETCRALIRSGSDPDALDADGRSALDHVPPHCCATAAEKNLWKAVLGDPPRKRTGQLHTVKSLHGKPSMPSTASPKEVETVATVATVLVPLASMRPNREPSIAEAHMAPQAAPVAESPHSEALGQRGQEEVQPVPSEEPAQPRPSPPAEEATVSASAGEMLQRQAPLAHAKVVMEASEPTLPSETSHTAPAAPKPTSHEVAVQTSNGAAIQVQSESEVSSKVAEPMLPQEPVQAVEAPPQEPPQEEVSPDGAHQREQVPAADAPQEGV